MKKKAKKTTGKKSKGKAVWKGLLALLILLLAGALLIGYRYYKLIYISNVDLGPKKEVYLYIPTGSNFDSVKNLLYKEAYIVDKNSFEWLCEKKGYSKNVKSGRYLLKDKMSNNELINLLRSGKQNPVKLTFNNIRTKEQLASRISKVLEADSASLILLLNNSDSLKSYGFNEDNIMAMFIADTYEFYWDTPARVFLNRMNKEFNRYWNNERTNKATQRGLSPIDISIIASIVYEETKKKDEMSRVAGVYVNRINQKMPLQADPTIKFALKNFSLKRVLTSHTLVESPYNTYMHSGLPPGPICIVSAVVLDKVVNFEEHNYLYFCAREDFSGYHNFAETLAQHNLNAQKYHQALNRLKIR